MNEIDKTQYYIDKELSGYKLKGTKIFVIYGDENNAVWQYLRDNKERLGIDKIMRCYGGTYQYDYGMPIKCKNEKEIIMDMIDSCDYVVGNPPKKEGDDLMHLAFENNKFFIFFVPIDEKLSDYYDDAVIAGCE